MKRLEKIILVNYFVCDAQEIDVHGHTAFLGSNAAGKSAMLDAVQIVMMGANRHYLQFNVRTDEKNRKRSVRNYCLGVFKAGSGDDGIRRRKRDDAHTYITLIFRDDLTGEPVSAGVAITARSDDPDHHVRGLYVVSGLALDLDQHTVKGDGQMFPRQWKDFETNLKRARAQNEIGISLEINQSAERHVRALLHAIQPSGVSINPQDYMKSFKKTLHLSTVNDVSDFVRDFLIEYQEIKKEQAMEQIRQFRRLNQSIEEVKEKISALQKMEQSYRAIERTYQRATSYAALATTYEVEAACDKNVALTEEIESLEQRVESLESEQARVIDALSVANRALRDAEIAASNSPDARDLDNKRALLKQTEETLNQALARLHRQLLTIAKDLNRAVPLLGDRKDRESIKVLQEKLDAAVREPVENTTLRGLETLIEKACRVADDYLPSLIAHRRNAEQTLTDAENQFEEIKGSIENVRRGGVALTGGPARAVQALSERGIEARPVCEFVRVTDPAWHAAIESYLGRSRFALLVPPGQEDEAVRIIRSPQNRIAGAKIIQPQHFTGQLDGIPHDVLVASLIAGDDKVAVAFVRRQLGKLRKVSTEAELREHRQALTADGMLSKSGGTEVLELRRDLVLGRIAEEADLRVLREKLSEAAAAKSDAEQNLERLDHLVSGMRSTAGMESGQRQTLIEDVRTPLDKISELRQLIDSLNNPELESLKEQIDQKRDICTDLSRKKDDIHAELNRKKANIDDRRGNLVDVEANEHDARAREKALRKHIDYSAELVDTLRQELDEGKDGQELDYSIRIAMARDRADQQRNRLGNVESSAREQFWSYLNRYAVHVIDEYDDWRKAKKWIVATKAQLVDSELHEYEEQAQVAIKVAEESFRRDVALKQREGILSMKRAISSYNRMLKNCPPFTNDETYSFEYAVKPAYKDLHKFVMDIASADGTGSLFDEEGQVSEQIIKLLEESGQGNTDNPLDDFRMFFNFDLAISQHGKQYCWLSERNGAGSNGEHLTPFYVIAATALAHAYRIDPSRENDGAALMLMDEAFANMDAQNSLAAAKFIENLGLQMLMAAPSSEGAKFASFANAVYELDRFDADLHFTVKRWTEEGHMLMESDMPLRHPELIQQRAEEINAHDEDRS